MEDLNLENHENNLNNDMNGTSYYDTANEDTGVFQFKDLLAVSSGVDGDNVPNSAIALSLFTAGSTGEGYDEDSISFRDAVNYFTAYGNSLVVESVFSNQGMFELRKANQLIDTWLENRENIVFRQQHELHLIVTPFPLEGKLIMDVSEMIYAKTFQQNNNWHLVMVFSIYEDDHTINFIEDEDIDINALEDNVKRELDRQKEEIETDLLEANEELDAIENQNAFDEDMFSTVRGEDLGLDSEDNEGKSNDDNNNTPWMRTSK